MMGNRLSKIYTKTGDDGSTGLADGSRVTKDADIVMAMGDVDELNSSIGLILTQAISDQTIHDCLMKIQNLLFDIGGELAAPHYIALTEQHVTLLETAIDQQNQFLPPLKEFILPNGNLATCYCHLARSVCRRAERQLVHLQKTRKLNANSLRFVNRLSDFLFVTARTFAKQGAEVEHSWEHERAKT